MMTSRVHATHGHIDSVVVDKICPNFEKVKSRSHGQCGFPLPEFRSNLLNKEINNIN
jgi:hypothetical protein